MDAECDRADAAALPQVGDIEAVLARAAGRQLSRFVMEVKGPNRAGGSRSGGKEKGGCDHGEAGGEPGSTALRDSSPTGAAQSQHRRKAFPRTHFTDVAPQRPEYRTAELRWEPGLSRVSVSQAGTGSPFLKRLIIGLPPQVPVTGLWRVDAAKDDVQLRRRELAVDRDAQIALLRNLCPARAAFIGGLRGRGALPSSSCTGRAALRRSGRQCCSAPAR